MGALFEATMKKSGGFLDSAYTLDDESKPGEDDDLVPINTNKQYSSGKWRKGGTMLHKCREIYQNIDFILYSNKTFRTLNTMDIPTYAEIIADSRLGLPCWRYPSDHFCVGADLV